MAEECGQRDRTEDGGPPQVADDQHCALWKAVDKHAGHQRNEWKRNLLERREKAHLERAGVKRKDSECRQRQLADRSPECADSLAEPQLSKIGARPKATNHQTESSASSPLYFRSRRPRPGLQVPAPSWPPPQSTRRARASRRVGLVRETATFSEADEHS